MTCRAIAITMTCLAILSGTRVTLVPAWAADKEAETRRVGPVGISAGQVIDRDYFAAGALVEIAGTVNGDVYAAGGQVLIDGRVNGDVLVAGGRVTLSGSVAQDVRVAGGQVSLSGTVGRNVTVVGGNVELTPGAVVGGSLVAAGGNVNLAAPLGGGATVAAGSLILSNRVGGNVEAAVGSLRIGSKADIRGRVAYVSQREASVDPGARIEGPLTRRLPPAMPRPSVGKIFAVFAALTFVIMAVSFVSTLVLGFLSLRFLPRYHEAAVSTLRERPWVALGVGFVAAVVTPVATAILFGTVLGIPLGLILAAAYPVVLYWGRIFAVHRLGEVLCRLFRASPRPAWVFVLGLLAYYALALIPVLGWVIMLMVVVSGLGAELLARKDVYVAARHQEIL
jgi:cytoskeletal protein CcmA (bactofilin family)